MFQSNYEKIIMEELLSKIARQIMALDEDTLTGLLPKYKNRMVRFTPTPQWEESVLIYFIINGLRVKNAQFNEKIRDFNDGEAEPSGGFHQRPRLRLVRKKKDLEPRPDEEEMDERK